MCGEFCLTTQGSQYDFHVGFMYNKEDLTCACLYINDKLPTTPLGATMVDLNPGSTEQIGGTDGTSGFVCYENVRTMRVSPFTQNHLFHYLQYD